ncbi:MAG TPA: hypothetical protein DCG75_02975 [Bacteroidales bacterium]|nr:hypothetical protein [Bacteroidales bacterium]
MKKNYLKLTAALFAAITIGFTSCSEDTTEKVAPTVISLDVNADNSLATIYFSEGVYSMNDKTGVLTDADFTVTLSGGDLTLESSVVSHTTGANSASIALTYSDTISDGSDLLTVAIATDAIFDEDGLAVVAGSVNDNLNLMGTETNTFVVSNNISANTTWETGNIYILAGRIAVLDGITLTIEPGVVVKGQAGSAENATALLIARGAKLMAEGTAAQPIIFTSVADEIQPGEIESPNLDPTLNGLWGGLLVLGKAPISVAGDGIEASIEGVPGDDNNGKYGGTISADNSGIIKYVSIRHGGANIGEGNEINGLTLGGVGSGTVIENIEIIANQDDGVEFFGGTVNVKNVLVWNNGDDAIDTDQSWGGTLDNVIIINPGDEAFELDGPEGTMVAKHTIKNGSVFADGAEGLVDNDANSNVDMDNIYFFGLAVGQDFDELPTTYTCTFTDFEVTLPAATAITDFFKGGSDAFVSSVAAGANTVGADKTQYADWTWASEAGELADF